MAGAGLLALAVIWAWVGTVGAREKSRWCMARWNGLTIAERLDLYPKEIEWRGAPYRMTVVDVSYSVGPPAPDDAESWFLDAIDPTVRYQVHNVGWMLIGWRWRLGWHGWRPDALWVGG